MWVHWVVKYVSAVGGCAGVDPGVEKKYVMIFVFQYYVCHVPLQMDVFYFNVKFHPCKMISEGDILVEN